jgi:hypothetical protein
MYKSFLLLSIYIIVVVVAVGAINDDYKSLPRDDKKQLIAWEKNILDLCGNGQYYH